MSLMMSVRELNANLSKAIARAEAGETIEITRNGRAVAELKPKSTPPVRDAQWNAAYERMLARMADGFGPSTGDVTHEDKYGDAPL